MPHEQHSSGQDVVIHKVRPFEEGRLELTSAGVGDDGRIADVHTAYHDNLSPPLEWTRMLDAESFVLVIEDPDAPKERPAIHWMIWNIPGVLTGLPQGVAPEPKLKDPAGAIQGHNDAGRVGYSGPKPEVGHGVHRYHFQLFALDKLLPMQPSTSLPELLNALKGNTIAKAELIGTYEAPELH